MIKKRISTYAPLAVISVLVIGMVSSCANMARPGGGPKDETPPVFVKSDPLPNQVNVSKNKIEIEFDEIVLVEKVSEKVIISPPQKEMPLIRTSGRKVTVELKDTLLPNTTYTIDFSDAIVDNNERNVLENFAFSFSTGPVIDTLQISGILLNAENLEPVTGMLVGIHANLEDTAFTRLPFDRIALSDARGAFSIRNITPGTYRLYALKDLNRDYRFDNATEDIAFLDSTVTPSVETFLRADTLWTDTVTIDTIVVTQVAEYAPKDILLKVFNENFKSHYLEKNERPSPRKFSLYFSAANDTLPEMKPLNFEHDDWAYIEKNVTNDTIHYWIKDSLVYQMDTLVFESRYMRTDSLMELSMFTDTLKMIFRPKRTVSRERERKKKEEGEEAAAPVVEFLKMSPTIPSSLNVYDFLRFEYAEPVDSFDNSAVHLEIKNDTLWNPVTDFTFGQDSLKMRMFALHHKWKPGEMYRVSIDSLAAVSIYGAPTDKFSQSFKVRTLEEYSNLYLATQGIKDSAYVVLLNSNDVPVRSVPVVNGGAEFLYLDPGVYYARLFVDRNGNGKYDTGNYAEKRQPEDVYYYPKSLELKANWDVEQDWDVFALPPDRQKPRAIVKNKPKGEIIQEEKQEDAENEMLFDGQ
ncbi:MAG: Ig-like domain-containing protein [Coprobacter sp.]|nr:Ig-like domain-containing protein [Coprobacter sp.]